MRETDVIQKQYFENRERFADLLNTVIFDGEQVVRAENIQGEESSVNARITQKSKRMTVQKSRDLVRKNIWGMNFYLVGLENQTNIHYAMPGRVILLDALGYDVQMREKARMHRQKNDLQGDEYLSGFAKEDSLKPVCTFTLYYGKKPWDGATHLYEMLNFTEIPEKVWKYITDYPVHLIDVWRFPYADKFVTDLREVFGFIQNSDDKDKLRNYVEKNRERFVNMQEDAFAFIMAVTDAKGLEKVKEKYITKEKRCDMCRAITEMIEEGREEGRAEGREEARKMNRLTLLLLDENRIGDLRRAAEDGDYKERLMREYQIS